MKGSGEWLNDFWLTQNVQILLSKHLWFLWIPQGKIIKGKNAFYTKIIKDAYLPICNIMRTPRFPEQGLDLRPFPHLPQTLKVATIKHLKMKQWTYLSAPDVGQMQVFTSDFQNFLPGLSPFARPVGVYHCRAPGCSGQGVERKPPFSPPLCSWWVTDLVFASHQGPAHGVPSRAGRRGRGAHAGVRGDGGSPAWLMNSSKLWAIKSPPNLPFPLSFMGFIGLIGNSLQAENTLLPQSYTW